MTPGDDRDFDRFSARLDDEWRRERLRAALPTPLDSRAEAALLEELERADPLGAAAWRWRLMLRETFGTWPGRLALAGVACAFLVLGLVLGRATTGQRVATGGIPPTPIESPDYKPEARGALGIGAPVNAESERKFRQAMAFHGAPGFAAKALPGLREAVTLDRTNDAAQFWLGVALLLTDRPADAIAPLEAAVRLAPGSTRYGEYLLYAYLRVGDVDRALRVQTGRLQRPPRQ